MRDSLAAAAAQQAVGWRTGLLSVIRMDRLLRMFLKEAFAKASGERLVADADAVRVVVPIDRGSVTTNSCCVSVLIVWSLLESCEKADVGKFTAFWQV